MALCSTPCSLAALPAELPACLPERTVAELSGQGCLAGWRPLGPPPSEPSQRCRTSTASRSTARSSMRFMVPEGAYGDQASRDEVHNG